MTFDSARASTDWLELLCALEHELSSIPTPFLLVDISKLDRNIEQMQATLLHNNSLSLWPHMKTHKASWIATRQLKAGAVGITCATVEEARAVSASCTGELLIANVIASRPRLEILKHIAKQRTVTAVVDSLESLDLLEEIARRAGAKIGVLIEIDIGMGRNGVRSIEDGLRLAESAARRSFLEVRGVQAYEGHLVEIPDPTSRTEAVLRAFEPAYELLAEMRARDLVDAGIIGGGSTSTYRASLGGQGATAIQAGTYALMDSTYSSLAPEFEIAAAVVSTVLTVSRDRVVIDAGSKRLGTDWGSPRLLGVQSEHRGTSEEHSIFSAPVSDLRVGDQVPVAPGHICTTFSLYSRFLAVHGDGSLEVVAIDGRDDHA